MSLVVVGNLFSTSGGRNWAGWLAGWPLWSFTGYRTLGFCWKEGDCLPEASRIDWGSLAGRETRVDVCHPLALTLTVPFWRVDVSA